MRRLWRDYSLLVFYGVFWIAVEAAHAILVRWESTYPPHEAPWQLEWLMTVAENYSSELWQVGMFALVTIWLVAKGSPQSRDGDDETRERLNDIHRQLDRIEQAVDPTRTV